MDNDRVQDRVMYLEEREKRLEKETHELREQNELLEFRILELEENQDKVSIEAGDASVRSYLCETEGEESEVKGTSLA